jgi:hypothetical protein
MANCLSLAQKMFGACHIRRLSRVERTVKSNSICRSFRGSVGFPRVKVDTAR